MGFRARVTLEGTTMTEGDELFDQPVEAYLPEDNVLKWCGSTGVNSASPLELLGQTITADSSKADSRNHEEKQELVSRERREALVAVQTALAKWDPNQGPAHEEEVRSQLEKSLNEIAQRALAKLSTADREWIRSGQRMNMGYAYLFVASPSELELSDSQQQELMAISRRVAQEALEATRQEMSSVQIRNPQAYLAYKISRLNQETHQRRLRYGEEFFRRSLNQEQRSKLAAPD